MSGRKVFLTVAVILVVIVLLAGAGVGLYRLGYARGIVTAATLAEAGQLPHLNRGPIPGFDDGRLQGWTRGGMMFFDGHRPFGMFGFGGWIGGLLLLAGVVALVVLAVKALTRKHPAEVLAVPTPVAPAAVVPTPAKPTRGAKRT
jgi:hypothetical protein